jgi:hypothetical protein
MNSTDRADFEAELAVLFGGFPTFLTPPRIEAYWRGLQKMQMSTFRRCIEHVLGEAGSDKLPTVNTLWQISKNLRGSAPAHSAQNRTVAARVGDDYLLVGNRWLLAFLLKMNGVPEDAIPWLVELKNRIVEDFRNSGDECGGPQTAEWMQMALDAFTACADKRAAAMRLNNGGVA